jgi:hypothetical protein
MIGDVHQADHVAKARAQQRLDALVTYSRLLLLTLAGGNPYDNPYRLIGRRRRLRRRPATAHRSGRSDTSMSRPDVWSRTYTTRAIFSGPLAIR